MKKPPKTYFTGKACPYGHVCPRYETSHSCVECEKARARTRMRSLRKKVKAEGKTKWVHTPLDRYAPPPPESLAEALRAYSAPRTLTQVLMGDPCPGRSAADQKRAAGVVL